MLAVAAALATACAREPEPARYLPSAPAPTIAFGAPAAQPVGSRSPPPFAPAPQGASARGSRYGVPPPARPPARVLPLGVPPAIAHGSMDPTACVTELQNRGVPFRHASDAAPGVATPVRLAGPLNGVAVHGASSRRVGTPSVHDILDCRLALALDDLSRALRPRGVVGIEHLSMYRRDARVRGSGKPSQHALGLAIDVAKIELEGGGDLSVLRDWHGAISDPVCGPSASPRADQIAPHALRSIVCDAARRGLFHLILTPNYNAAHANHFHMDLQPGRPVLEPR